MYCNNCLENMSWIFGLLFSRSCCKSEAYTSNLQQNLENMFNVYRTRSILLEKHKQCPYWVSESKQILIKDNLIDSSVLIAV